MNVGPRLVVYLKISGDFAGAAEAYATRSEWPVPLAPHDRPGLKSEKFVRGYLALPGEPVICASKAATAVRKLSGMTLV